LKKEKKFGGMRGFDIASTLAGKSQEGIFLKLNSLGYS